MSQVEDKAPAEDLDAPLEQAAQWFLHLRSESARVEDLPEFRRWMESDPRNALAYRQVSATWEMVGVHAAAPEIMIGRRNALDDARRAAQNRWSVRRRSPLRAALAASILFAFAGGLAWLYSQQGVYTTEIGETRAMTLPDGSVVTLDARSRVRVEYQDDQRLIALVRGQARFDVAKDSVRPFHVQVGAQTVIALGTQFNVERLAGDVFVTMIEGHVAVTGVEQPPLERSPSAEAAVIELRTGEGLHVRRNGRASLISAVDVERATAWQRGKLFFDNEPLTRAAERFNRHSRLQIEVDPSAAGLAISGVFDAADANAFIEAVSAYFPVEVDRASASEVHLAARK